MVAGRPSLSYQGLIALFSTLMIASLLSSLAGFWKMSTSSAELLVIALAGVAYAWLLWRSPLIGLGLLAAGVAGGAVTYHFFPEWFTWVPAVNREWLVFWEHVKAFNLNTTFGPNIGLVFLSLTGVGMALLVVLESMTEGTTFWSITGGAAIFASQWLWYYDRSATAFMAYATFAFALWILAQAARRDAAWLASGRRIGYRSHVMTPVAWVLVASVLSALLPTDFSPLNLGSLGDKIQETFPVFRQLRGAGNALGVGRFSLRTTGFSPNMGALGGPVKLDNTLAMTLTTDTPLRETAYLRGASFYTYNGQTWLTPEPQLVSVTPGGDLPTSYGVDVLRDYITFSLTPQINMGGTLFSMLEPMRIDNLKVPYQSDTDGNLWTERTIAKGTTYQVNSRIPRYSGEQIRLISTAPEPESLKVYRQVPATLPRRVGDTTRAITAGAQHPFDKALAVEAYLRSMKYDLDVPASPSGRDFVDYFLFDLKEGYCTYYATAMAVMLRELDIPTRLVEGFAVPTSTRAVMNSEGNYVYEVRNTQAHAWVEAYFPGYGWITMDPTPRADLPLIDRSTPAPEASSLTPGSDGNETPTDELPTDPATQDQMDGNDPDPGAFDTPAAATRELPWALFGLAVLAGLALIGFRRMQAGDRIKASAEGEVVQEAWSKTHDLMARFSYGRQPDLTAQEYARKLGRDWPTLQDPAAKVAADYTLARYAPPGRPTDPQAAGRAREFWDRVRQTLIARYGWRSYLWNRIKSGIRWTWPGRRNKAS